MQNNQISRLMVLFVAAFVGFYLWARLTGPDAAAESGAVRVGIGLGILVFTLLLLTSIFRGILRDSKREKRRKHLYEIDPRK